jgi:hypothetical protein
LATVDSAALVRSHGSAGDDDRREPSRLHLSSEFATVSVEVDYHANGPRLRIENRQNQRVIYLDPLEVASLTWLTHDHLGPFLDPSQTGWRNDDEGA